jgi:hypothetical protein
MIGTGSELHNSEYYHMSSVVLGPEGMRTSKTGHVSAPAGLR